MSEWWSEEDDTEGGEDNAGSDDVTDSGLRGESFLFLLKEDVVRLWTTLFPQK